MPPSSQSLYFHLAMDADDDGVVEAFNVLKLTNSNDDDLRVLTSKGFVKILNEDLVAVIMDWTEHNLIRADRKVDSIYKDLLLQIVPDVKRIEPKERADTHKTTGRPLDNQMSAQDRLGKDRLGKDKEDATTSVAGLTEVFKIFEDKNPAIKRMYGNKTQRASAENLIKRFGLEKVEGYARFAVKILGMPYAPKVTTPYLLETKWADLEAFYHSEIGKKEEKSFKVML